MQKWEYRTMDTAGVVRKQEGYVDCVDLLNEAGQDGWELVCILSNNMAYLKRVVVVETAPTEPPPQTQSAPVTVERRGRRSTQK